MTHFGDDNYIGQPGAGWQGVDSITSHFPVDGTGIVSNVSKAPLFNVLLYWATRMDAINCIVYCVGESSVIKPLTYQYRTQSVGRQCFVYISYARHLRAEPVYY